MKKQLQNFRRYQLLDEPVEIAPCNKCGGDMAEKILFSAAQRRGVKHLDQFAMEIFSSATLTLIIKSIAI